MTPRTLTAVVSLAMALWLPAQAATTTLISVADNTLIDGAQVGYSNGAGDAIYIGVTQRDGERRGLLRFDLAAIPANATVSAARLSLTLVRSRPEGFKLGLHRALASWGEGASSAFGGIGAPAKPGDATWTQRFFAANPAQPWVAPGGDFDAAATASVDVPGALSEGAAVTLAGSDLVTQVQGWVNNPSTNRGWVLLGSSDTVPGAAATSAKAFASREHPAAAYRPTLVVTWTAPPPAGGDDDIPVPAWALLLLGVALAGALGRKR
jgi:hypothetical protein